MAPAHATKAATPITATCNSAVFSPPYTKLLTMAKVVAVSITTMIVTPESGLLLLPTIPAIYAAIAENKNAIITIDIVINPVNIIFPKIL